MPSTPEAWLRGPVDGVPPALMPAAHALIQGLEDLERALEGLTSEQIWTAPGGAASVGYHIKHSIGSLDRLYTYARGRPLSEQQRAALEAERSHAPHDDAAALRVQARAGVERALAQLRATPPESLLDPRTVGRAGLPSTVIGLLFHGAEHITRHAGQAITTAKIVKSAGGPATTS